MHLKAIQTHITDYAPKMHTDMKNTFLDKFLALNFMKAYKYSQLYKAPDCVIDNMIEITHKLPKGDVQVCDTIYKCHPDSESECYSKGVNGTITEKAIKACPDWQICPIDETKEKANCEADTTKFSSGFKCEKETQCMFLSLTYIFFTY